MEKGCAPSVVTADSVAMRVWPIACVPAIVARPNRCATWSGRPTSLKISMRLPLPTTVSSGMAAIFARTAVSRCLRDREDEMGVAHNMRQSRAAGLEAADDGGKIVVARSADRQLDRARRRGAVDGETGGIGPAIAQRSQHAGKRGRVPVRARGPSETARRCRTLRKLQDQ